MPQSDAIPVRAPRSRAAALPRFVAAWTLVCAGILKVHAGVGTGVQRDLAGALVTAELLLALWLASGWRPRQACVVACLCFLVFAGVSAHRALMHEGSCGCFGSVAVAPSHTALMDALIATGLLLSAIRPNQQHGNPAHALRYAGLPGLLAALAAVWAVLVLARGTQRVAHATFASPDENPHAWKGQPLPILDSIDVRAELARGIWIMLLYDPECLACERVVPLYAHMAEQMGGERSPVRVALIDVAPGRRPSDLVPVQPGGPLAGRSLAPVPIPTPTTCLLSDGIALAVWTGDVPTQLGRILDDMGD